MIAVLGVDGGQSGIRLRHSSDDRVIEVRGISHQEGDTIAAVAAAVADGWARPGFQPVDRVVLGLSTAPAGAEARERLCSLVAATTWSDEVWLSDDAVTAHAGALAQTAGVSLVAGTGVACLALRPDGEPWIIGGHGYLLGDEGGGFWIGRNGLRAALRSTDGRGPETALAARAAQQFGDLSDLHVRLHGGEHPVQRISSFAPAVLDAAAVGDAVAIGIVDEAAQELYDVARVGVEWVGGDDVALALGGRLLEPGTELRRRLDLLLGRDVLPVVVRSAAASALDGAVALGLSGDSNRYRGLIHVWTRASAG